MIHGVDDLRLGVATMTVRSAVAAAAMAAATAAAAAVLAAPSADAATSWIVTAAQCQAGGGTVHYSYPMTRRPVQHPTAIVLSDKQEQLVITPENRKLVYGQAAEEGTL
jgi:cytochrome c oxidase assembly factor CtaG